MKNLAKEEMQKIGAVSPFVLSSPKSWCILRELTCFWKGTFNICELFLSDYLVHSSCWCINQKCLEKNPKKCFVFTNKILFKVWKLKKFFHMNVSGQFVICIHLYHICMNFSSLNLCCSPQSSIISTQKHILVSLCFDIKCIYGSRNCYREL